jgi:hypothetical protein
MINQQKFAFWAFECLYVPVAEPKLRRQAGAFVDPMDAALSFSTQSPAWLLSCADVHSLQIRTTIK